MGVVTSERHFTVLDIHNYFDDFFHLPEGFLFGVALSGYQNEGGYNEEGKPLNNWADLESKGKVEKSGEAVRFWEEYEHDIWTAKEIGLNAFRLGIEWSRIQPCFIRGRGVVPSFDFRAVEHYSNIIAEVMKSGMEPMVTLHMFTHPYWLGKDVWLVPDTIRHFGNFVDFAVRELNRLLVEKHGLKPVKYWITINEPNVLAVLSYLTGSFPHKSLGVHRCGRAWGNLIAAHARAYDTIHRSYAENGFGAPLVSCNTGLNGFYYLEKFMIDLLNSRRNGVEERELKEYIDDAKSVWEDEIARCPRGIEHNPLVLLLERFIYHAANIVFDYADFENAISAVYSSDFPEKLDFLAVDFYDPFFSNAVKLPRFSDIRERRTNLHRECWEWVINPRALMHFLKAEMINASGLPVIIAENGMAYKIVDGRVYAREDNARRDVFLQSHIFEVLKAIRDGLPVKGYFHWTLFDNYEWGSYVPRFGLMTVDRTSSPIRKLQIDAWGVDAAGAYRNIICSILSGNLEKIADALTSDYI